MILSIGNVYDIAHWLSCREDLLDEMRQAVLHIAQQDVTVDATTELIEVVYVKQDPFGRWLSASPENATHVKVTLEHEGVEG